MTGHTIFGVDFVLPGLVEFVEGIFSLFGHSIFMNSDVLASRAVAGFARSPFVLPCAFSHPRIIGLWYFVATWHAEARRMAFETLGIFGVVFLWVEFELHFSVRTDSRL